MTEPTLRRQVRVILKWRIFRLSVSVIWIQLHNNKLLDKQRLKLPQELAKIAQTVIRPPWATNINLIHNNTSIDQAFGMFLRMRELQICE